MNVIRLAVAIMVAAIISVSAQAAENGVHIDYSEPLQQYLLQRTAGENQDPGSTYDDSLNFIAFGRRFEIELVPNHALLSSLNHLALNSRLGVYRGTITGARNSWARLVIESGIPRGLIFDGRTMFAVDVEKINESGILRPIIYRLEDLWIEPGTLSCSNVAGAKSGASLLAAVNGEVASIAAAGPGATAEIDFAVLGDFEFTSDKGANSEAALIARMNNVDGIFSAQLGVQININQIDTFATPADPFSDASEAGALLDELATYRNNTPAQNTNGLTHLFTGRELDGNTVGIAFGGALCLRRFGAALTQGSNSVTLDSLVAAHEIGHNFGAPHDGTTGSACESTAQDFLMAPNLNGSDTFSACSIAEMQDDVSRASCITPLAATDVSIIERSPPAPALLGDPASIEFDAINAGTSTLNNVSVDVSVPNGVSLNGVSAGGGNCTSGAGSASCTIGTIAAGSGATITLSVTATASGDATFNAVASVAGDSNSTNNQASSTLSVTDAVDLRVTAAAGAQVTIGENVSISLNIDNLATIAATGVAITLTPDAGIGIATASWSPGTCTITGGIVSCDAASLAAQSFNALQLSITGVTTGNQSYAIAITSNEADRDLSNNNISGQVRVNSVGGDDSGGGGSVGWISILLLTLIPAWRRRRAEWLRT